MKIYGKCAKLFKCKNLNFKIKKPRKQGEVTSFSKATKLVIYTPLLMWRDNNFFFYHRTFTISYHVQGKPLLSKMSIITMTVTVTYQSIHTTDSPQLLIFFLLTQNIYCEYLLEVPLWDRSKEYPQHMFSCKNKKNMNTSCLKLCIIYYHGYSNWTGPLVVGFPLHFSYVF